jgi:hypothetical protein
MHHTIKVQVITFRLLALLASGRSHDQCASPAQARMLSASGLREYLRSEPMPEANDQGSGDEEVRTHGRMYGQLRNTL